ncbi:MAG: hypothetical protein DMG75_09560 [Acidobacteria bacterium]|nr:MAG: hypothetical protein DMG75_09560 [Acidobacteriota bacterium]
MKKIGLLFLLVTVGLWGQDTNPGPASAPSTATGEQSTPQGSISTSVTFPTERVQTPTYADLYCAGFISKQPLPNADFVAGGLQTPNTTKFATGEIVYLAGSGYQSGAQFTIVRELKDPNRFETFQGQHAAAAAAGQPYAEIGWVRVVDTRSKMAIAQIEFSCDTIYPGDVAVPFVEKPAISFHPPLRFDRFVPATGKLSGRIVMAKDFDTVLGTGMKAYINVGSNQGVKVGDYFRAVRNYDADLRDPVDSLSFKASTTEDTQKRPPSIEPKMLTKGKGPQIHVRDLPRRAVGELVILSVTPTTATGMVVFAMEDVHVGDGVELDDQQQQAQLQQ